MKIAPTNKNQQLIATCNATLFSTSRLAPLNKLANTGAIPSGFRIGNSVTGMRNAAFKKRINMIEIQRGNHGLQKRTCIESLISV